jgi:hypothetical protein
MAEVKFYHQERADGGRRTGVTVDGDTVAHGFLPGHDEYDPALLWYVDVTLQTPNPPTRTNALAWLQSRTPEIRLALSNTASLLELGIDMNSMPAEFGHNGAEGPIRVTVSAMRRLIGRQIAQKINHFAETDWAVLFPVLTPHG